MVAFEGILFLGLLIIGGKVFEEIFVKLRQPGLLGNVLAGLLLGPSGFALIKPSREIEFFTSLGIFFLFLLVGIEEIDLGGLLSSLRRRLFYTAAVAFLVPFSLAFYFLTSIELTWPSALALAGVIGLSSLGVTARALSDMKQLRNPIGLEIFSITAILEFVGLIAIGLILQVAVDPSLTTPLTLLISILQTASFFLAAALFSIEILPRLLRLIRRHGEVKEIFFGILVGLLLIIVYAGEANGVHGALTALLLGVALSQMPKTDYIESMSGLRSIAHGIFVPIFFAGIGLQINFGFLSLPYSLIITFILVVVFGKFAGAFLGAFAARMPNPLAISSGVMAKGAVDLALMLTLLELGLINQSLFSLGTFSILLLLIISPLSMRLLLKREKVTVEQAEEDLIPIYARVALKAVKVKDIMSRQTLTVLDNTKVSEFIQEHLEKGRHYYNVVDSNGQFIGHVSIQDLRKTHRQHWEELLVGEVMQKRHVWVLPSDDIYWVLEKMTLTDITPIPVVDPKDPSRIIGTISRSEIIKLFMKPKEKERSKPENDDNNGISGSGDSDGAI
ncbi:MAG: cation:proton antiporter [Thaumarchaeota archaeon]|nr:cation:proton antiporter [Nitrososphaerota archaeon]